MDSKIIKHEKIGDSIEIYLGDCRDILLEINQEIDLAIFSPPYNVGVNYDNHNDKLSIKQYEKFARDTMKSLYPLMRSGGRICVEIGGSGRNFPMTYIWQKAAYTSGLSLFSEIGLQHRKTNPCAWGSWMKADAVWTIPNFHMLYVFYKENSHKIGQETTIEKDEFMEWTRGYWKINWSIGSTKKHPAQFPVEIPTRCLRLFGHKDDLVIDPFMGLGTTGIACHEQERRFIGIDKSEKYYNLAKIRITKKVMQKKLF